MTREEEDLRRRWKTYTKRSRIMVIALILTESDLLYYFGGVYLDYDVLPAKAFPSSVLGSAFTLAMNRIGQDETGYVLLPEVAFMASKPGGKFVSAYRDKIARELTKPGKPDNHWFATGPTWLSEVLTETLAAQSYRLDPNFGGTVYLRDITILPCKSFYSVNQAGISRPISAALDDAKDDSGVYGVHTWAGSWHKG